MNYLKLDMPGLRFNEDFVYPKVDSIKDTQSWNFNAADVMHKNDLDFYADTYGINLNTCLIFWLNGKKTNNIHIDGYGTRVNTWAINYIPDQNTSEMRWFKPLKESVIFKPDIGNLLQTWEQDAALLIDVCIIASTKPTLVRTNIPHQVHNFSETPRWAFSFRGGGNGVSTWDEVVNRLTGVSTTESA